MNNSKDDKVVAIIQARMGSSRLPGKVLKEITGKPMLAYVYERTRLASKIDEVLIATTVDPSDDAIASYCDKHAMPVYRGSLHDVLDRYYQAAKIAEADIIVRLTADCPLLDAGVLDEVIEALLSNQADFSANRLPPPWKRTYPIGLDVEVCTFKALESAWENASETYHREHVMPFLYEEAGRFKVIVLDHDPDYGSMRWTVDTQEDLTLIRKVVDRLGNRIDFTWLEVLTIFENEPELALINQSIKHKTAHDVDKRQEGK